MQIWFRFFFWKKKTKQNKDQKKKYDNLSNLLDNDKVLYINFDVIAR